MAKDNVAEHVQLHRGAADRVRAAKIHLGEDSSEPYIGPGLEFSGNPLVVRESILRHAPDYLGAWTGNVKMNVVPRPGADWTSRVPW